MGVLPVGACFYGRYDVVRLLKTGGMGCIYEVTDRRTHRRRALKVMLPAKAEDADLGARFKLEATITGAVESEHIVETFDADVDPETGSPFLVMELLRGEDLSAVLETRGRLDRTETVRLLGQLASALDKTHAAGIVHRDLKPENLFVARSDDGAPRVKVLDFGIAKIVAQTAKTTRVLGTPLYMSKEQILGEGTIGPPADLYALGHLAYTLLVGEAYWSHEATTSPAQYVFLSKVLKGAVEAATARAARRSVELPAAFDGWFQRATALEPEFRFESASAMVSSLADVLGVAALPSLAVHPSASPAMLEARDASVPPGSPHKVTGAPVTSDLASTLARSGTGRLRKAWLAAAALPLAAVVAIVARGTAPPPHAGSEPRSGSHSAAPPATATSAQSAPEPQASAVAPEPPTSASAPVPSSAPKPGTPKATAAPRPKPAQPARVTSPSSAPTAQAPDDPTLVR
jgi:eukaryotic-like serine/threonine-protein kinase